MQVKSPWDSSERSTRTVDQGIISSNPRFLTRKKHKKRQLPVISMMLVLEEINNGDGK